MNKSLGQLRYYQYLRSNHWKGLRTERLKISNHTCELCGISIHEMPTKGGTPKHINCHHVIYRPNWFDTKVEDIRSLHRVCHTAVENALDSRELIPSGTTEQQWEQTKVFCAHQIVFMQEWFKKISEARKLKRLKKSIESETNSAPDFDSDICSEQTPVSVPKPKELKRLSRPRIQPESARKPAVPMRAAVQENGEKDCSTDYPR